MTAMNTRRATVGEKAAHLHAEDANAGRLSGNMSTTSLVLSVLAFSGPIVTVAGYIAFAIGFMGEGAPMAWIVATAVLLLFAVGYTTMTRHVPRPGAFYAYISLGLSKVVGVGAAYLATLSYTLLACGMYVFAGATLSTLAGMLGVGGVPWWAGTLGAWLLVTGLAHFNIELSAKVLGIVMVLEVALVVLFNVFVLGKGGAQGISLTPYNPTMFFTAGTGMALLFAFSNFIGFEATALYRDEVRNPDKTVPRATYLAVIFIGAFYSISAFSLITAFGPGAAEIAASEAAGGMFNTALDQYVLPNFSFVSLIVVATSAIAGLLSVHNVTARYLLNLGSDRVLPSYLGAVHPRHGSPYKASLTAGLLMAALIAPFAITQTDPTLLVAGGSGIGTAGVLILMTLVSLAVIVWFARNRGRGEGAWRTVIAPALSLVGIGSVVTFAVVRFDLLVGGAPGQNAWMLLVVLGVLLAGAGIALYYRLARPALYARLGRADADDPESLAVMGPADDRPAMISA